RPRSRRGELSTREEAHGDQAHSGAGENTDRCTAPADSFGAFGAVGEQVEQLILREVVSEGAEPRFEPGVGGAGGGDLQASGVAAGDAHRGATQVIVDDTHLAPHDVSVERLARAGAGVEEAGVEVDALASHGGVPRVRLRYV